MQLGATPLAEPFFEQTITRLKTEEDPPREIVTGLEAILTEGAGSRAAAPVGLVFHISRCGSSLIANGLRTARAAQVLAEARPLTSLFFPRPPTGYASADELWRSRRDALARSLASIYSSYRRGEPEPIVIKWTSLNTVMLPSIRAVWPDTPCLFVVRNPLEVLVANLQPGGLIDTRRSAFGPGLSGCSARRLAKMPDEEYCARVIGNYLTTGLAELDADVWVIDYDDVNRQTLRAAARRFGLKLPFPDEVLGKVFERHAKDPTAKQRFRDDRRRKRRQATTAATAAVKQWAEPAYRSLLASRNRLQ